MTLDATEFIRRFLLHVLPSGFFKIRYYGLLCNRSKKQNIEIVRKLLGVLRKYVENTKESLIEMYYNFTGINITLCTNCKKGKMISIYAYSVSLCT